MNRSLKIRYIYAELRSTLGKAISEQRALEYAAALMDMFDAELEEVEYEDESEADLSFCQWEVDRAFSDGGMRMLKYEPHWFLDTAAQADHEEVAFRRFRMINERRLSV